MIGPTGQLIKNQIPELPCCLKNTIFIILDAQITGFYGIDLLIILC